MDDGDHVPEVNFIDIAQRSSTVTSDAAPSRLLEQTLRFQDPKNKAQADGCVLFKAVLDNDFEAFVQIAELYKFLPKPIDLPTDTLVWVLQHDRSTMLDELIRRTGRGIELPEEDQSEEEATDEAKPRKLTSKTYFGLNVHGKKRKDLVAKSDPDAPPSSRDDWELPLLWQAAYIGAIECVRYLATERPVSAYQYYVSTHTDDRAQYLKRINDQIPQRLGWTMDELNESVITAAVIGNELEVLKTVIDLQPVQLQSSLMARYDSQHPSRFRTHHARTASSMLASIIYWSLPIRDARPRCSTICCRKACLQQGLIPEGTGCALPVRLRCSDSRMAAGTYSTTFARSAARTTSSSSNTSSTRYQKT